MPVAGEVIEVNEGLNDSEIVNFDPYGDGWMIKVRPVNFTSDSLLDAEACKKEIGD